MSAYFCCRTSSRSIPITQRDIASKNGSQTIVLPPPVYPHALDIGLKGMKEKTNTLLVKQLPIYISNVHHANHDSEHVGRKNVYSVEIYKHKKQTENNPTNNLKTLFPPKEESGQSLGTVKEEEPLFSSANGRSTDHKEEQELLGQKQTNELRKPSANGSHPSCCDKSTFASNLQTLLCQPKNSVVNNKTVKGPYHTVRVLVNNHDSSVSANSNAASLTGLAETNFVKSSGGISISDGHGYSDLDPPEVSGELTVQNNFEETNVVLANLETSDAQPVLLESVQILRKEDHSYFVIDNNEDIDGVNVQEVVIDNSGL